ncbi:MAG TPA: hypothetical protein VHO69_16040 [Phototrophicaceae bacterium]|nr:hypothetical protein [Phototrophicaceae bacterium]
MDEENQTKMLFQCAQPQTIKLIAFIILLILAVLVLNNVAFCNGPVGWIWCLLLVVSIVLPRRIMRFYEQGVEINSLGTVTFFDWSDFKEVHKGSINTQIYFVYHPEWGALRRLGLPYPFSMVRWETNYGKATQLMREKLGEKFKEHLL